MQFAEPEMRGEFDVERIGTDLTLENGGMTGRASPTEGYRVRDAGSWYGQPQPEGVVVVGIHKVHGDRPADPQAREMRCSRWKSMKIVVRRNAYGIRTIQRPSQASG